MSLTVAGQYRIYTGFPIEFKTNTAKCFMNYKRKIEKKGKLCNDRNLNINQSHFFFEKKHY